MGRSPSTHPVPFHMIVFCLPLWSLHRKFCPMISCPFSSVLTLSAKMFPLSTPPLTTLLPLVSPAPVPGGQDFDVLCFVMQFSSHWVEGSNSRQHRLCFAFHMFSQVSKLFGIQSSRWMWKENGCVSSSQSLISTAEAKDGYIYADQNRFLKCLPAPFEQSAYNYSCCTGGSTSKSWVEYEVWFIFVVGQLPVFPLSWSCVNPALIFSELMWEMLCPHLYTVDFFFQTANTHFIQV